ncbi:MAG: RNA polymerase sigma factor [Bacteroidetes bacterium]|nr:RNA polymerase sigma factor [Bacteroidota bacterium]
MTATDFNYIVVQHSEFLKPFAVSLTKDVEDAKDLFQETMMRALIYRDKYQFGTNLKGWLHTIMRNVFINNYRRSKKFRTISAEKIAEGNVYDQRTTIHNEGFQNVRHNEVKKAIDELPEIFRLCFELYYAGYKYQEIAEIINQPLGTVKSRIHFARKTLMEKLER